MEAAYSFRGEQLRRAGWLAFAAAVLTVGLVTYGAWVRVSGSGLGCPDWPLCDGAVVPKLEGETAVEFGHRVYAGVTMLTVGAAAWFAYRGRRADPTAALLVGGAFGAILFQAALGGATIVLAHPFDFEAFDGDANAGQLGRLSNRYPECFKVATEN